MAKQINQYTKTRTSLDIADDDLMDLDSTDDSGSTFESAKLKISELVTYLGANATNIYNGNGTLTSQRLVRGDNFTHSLGFSEIDQITWQANTAFLTAVTNTEIQSPLVRIIASDGVGINQTTPNAMLQVKAFTGLGNENVMVLESSLGDLVTVKDDGNVGIGTAAPSAKLHVEGSTTSPLDTAFLVENTVDDLFTIKNDGQVFSYGRGAVTSNTAYGKNTLNSGTTGIRNSVIGEDVGSSLISGTNNVLFGWNTGKALTTGGWNTFIGSTIATLATSASSNTVIGYNMSPSISGNHNILVGYSSALALTSGARNVMIGKGTGLALTTGSSNVFIGNDSGSFETGSNKLFIDNQVRANEATARTNSMIYGEFNANVSNQKLTFNANVGIGIATPTEKLHVEGSIRMVDGNEGVGKILVSDADGVGSWTTAPTSAAKYSEQFDASLETLGVAKTITHSLGSTAIVIQLWDDVTGAVIEADLDNRTTNTVDVTFNGALPSGNVTIIILG